MTRALVKVRDLSKHYQQVRAVDGVSLEIDRGETLGLVGESGCGKTTLGRCLLRLIEPTSGEIEFDGIDLRTLDRRRLREIRQRMQIIFQDPYSSLNPRMTVGEIIAEPLQIHRSGNRNVGYRGWAERVVELLGLVGLEPDHARRYPHQFSGGQRQRIGIARALALNPEFIVADEPVSALDVSIQAQIVNLLQDLQERLGLTCLFISHGLAVVRHLSTRVGVMYRGKLVELAPAAAIYSRPLHPYTKSLLAAIPVADPNLARPARIGREGLPALDLPMVSNSPDGCRFHALCPDAVPRCRMEDPPLREVAPGHWVACIAVEGANF
jgi:oligopeptide/dipeptide ABC transporter ATP-binding protein